MGPGRALLKEASCFSFFLQYHDLLASKLPTRRIQRFPSHRPPPMAGLHGEHINDFHKQLTAGICLLKVAFLFQELFGCSHSESTSVYTCSFMRLLVLHTTEPHIYKFAINFHTQLFLNGNTYMTEFIKVQKRPLLCSAVWPSPLRVPGRRPKP